MTGPQKPEQYEMQSSAPSTMTPGGGAGARMSGWLRPGAPDLPQGEQPSITVVSFPEYADAQRAVDYLSDQGFPVQNTSIVGTNLRLVEQVIGRMTTARAALSGAGAGAWLGLLIGLLLGLFSVGGWLAVVLTAVAIGAVWGAILGAVAHATTRGARDFSSASRLQASEYAVNVTPAFADQARQILGRLQMG